MYGDIEEMLTRELREVADHVEVPPLPDLPSEPPVRFAWQPLLVAAAVVLVALVTLASLLPDGNSSPQPAPRPTEVVTDDATDTLPAEVPTGPPAVPYLLDGVLHVEDRTYPDFAYLAGGTTTGWLVGRQDFSWWWGNTGRPRALSVAVEQPPGISPNGEYVAYVSTEGEMNGFQTAPAGEGMGLPVDVPVRGEDGVGTLVTVTDDGLVVASATGVGVLWRPFVDGETVDLTETAPDQRVLAATPAGVVVQDDTAGPEGAVYLADLTADGTITRLAGLPDYGRLEVAGDWLAGVPLDVIGGEVMVFDEIEVRRIDGSDAAALTAPDGWQFVNARFSFEDGQFLVARVTDGRQERMVRCSPALVECVLLDTPVRPR
jgi:hypothetical protein